MSCSDDQRRRSAEDVQTLLAVFDMPAPPDFAAQVLARVDALQTARGPHPAAYVRPLPCQQPSRGGRRVGWPVWRQSRIPLQGLVAGGLLVMSAGLLWCVLTSPLPMAAPEQRQSAYTAFQNDTVADAALHGAVAAAEPAPQPIRLATPSREAPTDTGDLTRGEEHAAPPEAPPAAGRPDWIGAATKPAIQAQAQRSGRQHGLRGKAKRSGKGLRLSRHVSAYTNVG